MENLNMTGGTIFVSIVVPVYNGQRTIEQCVLSLINQDYPKGKFEIIVVDNMSTDNTTKLLEKFPVKVVSEREFQSSYAARNRGIQEAKSELIAFTDADCIAEKNWLNELIKPFSDENVGAVGGIILNYPPETLVERFIYKGNPFQNFMRFNGKFLPIMLTGNIIFKRPVFDKIGLFRANLYTIADIDMGWRIQLESNFKLIYAENAIVSHMHRTTLPGLYKQQHRAGFGRILLGAMYGQYPDYPYPGNDELHQMGKQVLSILIYLSSIVYRRILYWLGKRDRYEALVPWFCLVAETGNLMGRIKGLWITRFYRRNPALMRIEDPRES